MAEPSNPRNIQYILPDVEATLRKIDFLFELNVSAVLHDFDFISDFPSRCKWPRFEGIDGQGHFPSRAHVRACVRTKLMNIDLRESAAYIRLRFHKDTFFFRCRNGTRVQLQSNLNLILRRALPALRG